MGKQQFTVELTDKKVVYHGGETISGNLVLETDDSVETSCKFKQIFCCFVACDVTYVLVYSHPSNNERQSFCPLDRRWGTKYEILFRERKVFQTRPTFDE